MTLTLTNVLILAALVAAVVALEVWLYLSSKKRGNR